MNYIYKNKFKSTKTVFSEIQARSVGMLPIRTSAEWMPTIVALVDQCLARKKSNFNSDIGDLERQIDDIVYKIYGLSDDDIKIIEADT